MDRGQARRKKRAGSRRTFRFSRRMVLIFLIALALIAGVALFLWPRNVDLAASIVKLPFLLEDSYATHDQGIVYYKDGAVHALNTLGAELWDADCPGQSMKVSASSSLIAVYSPSTVNVLDSKGKALFSREFLGTIQRVAVSESMVCVFRKTTQSSDITVLNASGGELNTIDMGAQDAVAFGTDDTAGVLWVLALDTSASVPVTRLSIYKGGSTISGLITVDTHLVTGALFSGDLVYLLGSTHVLCYDYKGNLVSSQLVYGWNIEDAAMQSGGKPLLVLTPDRDQNTGYYKYPAARLIAYGDTESILSLPPNCFDIVLGAGRIYCFSSDAVHVFGTGGKREASYPLGRTVDRVGRPFGGTHILAFADKACYLVPLP